MTAIFTISKGTKGYNIKCSNFNTYNAIEIPGFKVVKVMEELADTFNNTLKIGILFEME